MRIGWTLTRRQAQEATDHRQMRQFEGQSRKPHTEAGLLQSVPSIGERIRLIVDGAIEQ